MEAEIKEIKKFDILCVEGDPSQDLYFIHQGKLLAFLVQGSEIKPLSVFKPGEFVGELSFFDSKPRSSFLMALEPTTLVFMAQNSYLSHLPEWIKLLGRSLTNKIRLMDQVISEEKIRKKNEELRLSIEEQNQILHHLKSRFLAP